MGIQWQSRAGGLQGPVFSSRLQSWVPIPHHPRQAGEGVYHWGPGRVDRIRNQSAGVQWHRARTVEPTSSWENQRVRWEICCAFFPPSLVFCKNLLECFHNSADLWINYDGCPQEHFIAQRLYFYCPGVLMEFAVMIQVTLYLLKLLKRNKNRYKWNNCWHTVREYCYKMNVDRIIHNWWDAFEFISTFEFVRM